MNDAVSPKQNRILRDAVQVRTVLVRLVDAIARTAVSEPELRACKLLGETPSSVLGAFDSILFPLAAVVSRHGCLFNSGIATESKKVKLAHTRLPSVRFWS